MSFLERLLQILGISPPPSSRQFSLDADLRATLQDLAELEQRPLNEIANDLIQQALDERLSASATMRMWHQITPRQQEVTALVCLGYTNQEIGRRLSISPETVKSHLRAVLRRYDLRNRTELGRFYNNWDFSEWDK